MSDARVEVGRLGAAHGVRGWLRVQSFTDPPQRLFEWKRWFIREREMRMLEARPQGKGWIVRLEGVEERDAASQLTGQMILVDRESLPPTRGREYYRDDLIGLEAVNREGRALGVVDGFIELPAHPVVVLRGERERLVPLAGGRLIGVDLAAGRVTFDWHEDD